MLLILLLLTIIYSQFNFAFNVEETLKIRKRHIIGDNAELPNLRISDKKCKEYQSPIYDKWYERDILTGKNITLYIDKCPHAFNPYIIGGYEAKPKEFPHMALIGSSQKQSTPWFCGGTLISEEAVLTAAHCTNQANYTADLIRLGELDYDRKFEDAAVEEFVIVKKFLHPNYTRTETYNDIAIFKMNRKVNFTRYIRPACLSTAIEDYETEYAIATGWGATYPGEGSRLSNILKKVVIKVFDFNECNMYYQNIRNKKNLKTLPNGIRNISQICFGSRTDESDTCKGDSGGPLQIYHHDYINYSCMYSVIGVTALGPLCGAQFPGIYTRVYYYLDWIENIVWPNQK